jgi:chromosome segregation ATPase
VSHVPPEFRPFQIDRDRMLFEIRTLERDIERIEEQLDEAEGTTKQGTDWWHRAQDALRHKQKDRRICMARVQRLNHKLAKVKPDQRKAEAKAQIREILRALFLVARTALDLYEDDNELTETRFTDALDKLDQIVPDWDQPQPVQPKPTLRLLGLDD